MSNRSVEGSGSLAIILPDVEEEIPAESNRRRDERAQNYRRKF